MSKRMKNIPKEEPHRHVLDTLRRREIGAISSHKFSNRVSTSEEVVSRIEMDKKLTNPGGSVHSVSFSDNGYFLISGGHDRRVNLWDWSKGKLNFWFDSGHAVNHAKFMPESNDRTIVSCGVDGTVRCATIVDDGARVETFILGSHQGEARKLCLVPGNPHQFYTCGDDGIVQRFDIRTQTATKLFICPVLDDSSGLQNRALRLNSISMNPRKHHHLALGGSDLFARLYDIRRYRDMDPTSHCSSTTATDHFCPPHLLGCDNVTISGLAFSDQDELIVSYRDEFSKHRGLLNLFEMNMGLGPTPLSRSNFSPPKPKPKPLVYKGHTSSFMTKDVSFFGPGSKYVVTGSNCGRIFIWRKKPVELIHHMEADGDIVTCIESHPDQHSYSSVLAGCGGQNDIKVWSLKA